MYCQICKTPMAIRNGKFGQFYYCPNGRHGTISVEKYKRLVRLCSEGHHVGGAPLTSDPLMTEIERQTVHFGGILTDLDRFCVDSESYSDEEDYEMWEHVRPY